MKRLTLAALALALIAAPAAFAKDAVVQDTSAKTPPSSTAPRSWNVGDRIPSDSILRRYGIDQPAEHKLKAAPYRHRWVLVDGKAYLINEDNLRVREVVTPEQK